ncbi:MAG: secreted hydrolase, alpha/beta family [Myxococcaceae bacterium]|nr:secreted hydrolase, alpha/beta family [Myxococcaceae bacterium]
MRSQSGTRLCAVVALTLLGACGDDSAAKQQEVDTMGEEPLDGGLEAEAEPVPGSTGAKRDARVPTVDPDAAVAKPDAARQSDAGPALQVDGSTPVPAPDGGTGSHAGGACCKDGDCLCHGPEPKALTSDKGPYKTQSYALAGAGCVFYPTDAEPPFAAVTVSDGFGGTGGCGPTSQTGQWGPLYASWGIVTMIVDTTAGDQPNVRGQALTKGVAAFKTENTKKGSPLEGKLSGRYGTSGFSMGGGGTTYASQADDSLLSSVAIMPWGPVRMGVKVPTLVICGSNDTTAPCASHGTPAYQGIADSVPKMRVQVTSGHAGQPTAGMGKSGAFGLAFQKVFLEGDERWRPLLVSADSEESNIK